MPAVVGPHCLQPSLLQDLQQLTGLQVLGLSNCYEVTGGGVLALAEHATGLRRLELYNCEVLDEHLEGFSRVSGAAQGAQHQHHQRCWACTKGCSRVSQPGWPNTEGCCCPFCINWWVLDRQLKDLQGDPSSALESGCCSPRCTTG